jgi:hypothetical protein
MSPMNTEPIKYLARNANANALNEREREGRLFFQSVGRTAKIWRQSAQRQGIYLLNSTAAQSVFHLINGN